MLAKLLYKFLTHEIKQLDEGSKFFRRVGNSAIQKTAIPVTMHQIFPCSIFGINSESRRFVARLRGTLLAEAAGGGGRHAGPHGADHTAERQCIQRTQPR